jgi:ABC-type multidrug transport system fused ATPase/permease subunit
MSILSSIGSGIVFLLSSIWYLFLAWLWIFILPILNPNLLWIIVPIWISWFFAEFFQEKKSTGFGNAISNGVIPMWVAIDWTRQLVSELVEKNIKFGSQTAAKFTICLIIFTYGLTIIISGVRGRQFVKYLGRIREVTYVLLMFTPIIYGVLEISWQTVLAILVFFPVFYYLIEIIDRITPDPKASIQEEKEQQNSMKFSKF